MIFDVEIIENPEFLPAVRLAAEAGAEAMVDAYLPAIAFMLSNAWGERHGNVYEGESRIPVESYQYSATSAVGEHEIERDMTGAVLGRIHVASAEGEPPAELTGLLRESGGSDSAFFETSAEVLIGPNATNPDTGEFYGQILEHGWSVSWETKEGSVDKRYGPRPAWGRVLLEHFGPGGDGLLEGAFAEGFAGAAG